MNITKPKEKSKRASARDALDAMESTNLIDNPSNVEVWIIAVTLMPVDLITAYDGYLF